MEDAVFVVQMVTDKSETLYAGKESWEKTSNPKFVMSYKSALGKARWWKKISNNPLHSTNLVALSVIPVTIAPDFTSEYIKLIEL